MVVKEDELRETIEKAVRTLRDAGAREVYIFGSAAKGTMHEDSDLDFAVVGLPPERLCGAIAGTMSATGVEVHLVDLGEDTPFVRGLKQEGELRRVG
jgi:predicted nucleotidyltransferase